MPRKRSKADIQTQDRSYENYLEGVHLLASQPILYSLYYHASIIRQERNLCPPHAWAVVTTNGVVHVNPHKHGLPKEWLYVLAHCLLHLGFGHFEHPHPNERAWNAACDCFVAKFLADLKIGEQPEDMRASSEPPSRNEERTYALLCENGIPDYVKMLSTAGPQTHDMLWEPVKLDWQGKKFDWQACFGRGLASAASTAIDIAAGIAVSFYDSSPSNTPAQQARAWFINSYPLLGALAASFKMIEDMDVCRRMDIAIAAVDAQAKEIYLNPTAGLDEKEMRFVIAHELLHVGLRHEVRRQGRDPFLWNVACDYVINAWLVEMQVGTIPRMGLLYDPQVKGESAEAIYDRIVKNIRYYRKLKTFRGYDKGDMLGSGTPEWWGSKDGLSLDDFYRRALGQGLSYHQQEGRGYLPADLIEEIEALSQPPIPWDVELAMWFDHYFPLIEKTRSYAHPSRHQSSTPDIPRPRWVPPPLWDEGRTFGVLLDTSGSMERSLLAKALGAIASYSLSREVPAARVVFCDAVTYDQGYMPPEAIADKVKVRGRGGTVLQPGIDLLERAEDFPKEGPILIITDGRCDKLQIRREHAFLLPAGADLPFVPRGPVFRIS
jgi:predicted metal-dependent peptidase